MKCNYCGKTLKKDTKVCDKCGKEVGKELTNIEQTEKKVRNIGVTINAIGWLTIIINGLLYGIEYVGGTITSYIPDLTGILLFTVVGLLFVILGNRIKDVYDKNIKKYLTILLIVTILFSILAWSTGGAGGAFVLIYLIVSLSSYNKYLKEDEYKEKLEEKEHKIKKTGWILLIISTLVLGWLGLNYDMNNLYTDITASDVEEVTEFIKNSNDLPQRIDEVTVWLDVTAEEDAIRYHYELSNLGERAVSEELLRDFIEDGICADRDIKNALEGGIDMEYFYTVKETGEDFLVVFTKEDCL
jgi:hypothetical protein